MQKNFNTKFIVGFMSSFVLFIVGIITLLSFVSPVKGSYDNGYYSLVPGILYSRNKPEATLSAPILSIETQVNTSESDIATQSKPEYCLYVPVLMYHHIQPYNLAKERGQTSLTVDNAIFDQQMAYLISQGYTSVSAEDLANALRTHSSLPLKPIVITMDDGYKDNFIYAFPVIQKYNLIANIMIPTGLLENPDFLSWNDLKTMVDSGRFYAYDHTWSHVALGNISSDKIETEIMTAKKQLEEHLGKSVNIFAYPYGSENTRVINALVGDGFSAAFSTIPGTMQCDSFIMTLHRTRIGNASLASYGL